MLCSATFLILKKEKNIFKKVKKFPPDILQPNHQYLMRKNYPLRNANYENYKRPLFQSFHFPTLGFPHLDD